LRRRKCRIGAAAMRSIELLATAVAPAAREALVWRDRAKA
jgi:hypothetical protein